MTAVIALASPLPVLVIVIVWSRVAGRRARARRAEMHAPRPWCCGVEHR